VRQDDADMAQLITMEKTTTEDVPPPTFDKNEEEYERLAGKEPGHYQFNRKVSSSLDIQVGT
jgi:hypothetical protein